MRAIPPIAAPIPALAPVERPLEEVEVLGREVEEDVGVEVVEDLLVVLAVEEGVVVAVGVEVANAYQNSNK